MAARAAVLALAVLALAALGSGLRSARLQERASEVTTPEALDDAEIERRRGLIADARAVAPDGGPLTREVTLLLFARRFEAAVPVAERLVRLEPESYQAWGLLASAAASVDPARAREARERALALNPVVAGQLRRRAPAPDDRRGPPAGRPPAAPAP